MKETPILYTKSMVQAVLDLRKTQTRRGVGKREEWRFRGEIDRPAMQKFCPYGQPGDRLWVKETFQFLEANSDGQVQAFKSKKEFAVHDYRWIEYAATPRVKKAFKWKPSIFMPRWASRLTLEIVSVRVERLRDISETDAVAEGCGEIGGAPIKSEQFGRTHPAAIHQYALLWESINGAGSWAKNPWVWVIEFKKL